jgi:hypothetical protein
MIRVVHPGSWVFLLITEPGVKNAPDPGSATLIASNVKLKYTEKGGGAMK